jgi:hypothetical protein
MPSTHCLIFIPARTLRSHHITLWLFGIDVPDNIVWQTIDAVASPLGHLGKALGLGLVFKGVAGKVDAGAMHVCFDNDVDATDTVEGDFFIFVAAPVTYEGHVFAVGGELLVSFGENHVFG